MMWVIWTVIGCLIVIGDTGLLVAMGASERGGDRLSALAVLTVTTAFWIGVGFFLMRVFA